MLLYADVNTNTDFIIPIATNSPSAVDGNKLVPGTGTAVASTDDGGTTYNYVLSVVNNEVNFYKAAGNTVATTKAYLKDIPATTSAKIYLPTGEENGETDGINAVVNNTENGAAYNLAGQKVDAAYKGIVIVNGKKYINK